MNFKREMTNLEDITKEQKFPVSIRYADVEKFLEATLDENPVHRYPESTKTILKAMRYEGWESLKNEIIFPGMLTLLKIEHEISQIEEKKLAHYDIRFDQALLVEKITDSECGKNEDSGNASDAFLVACSYVREAGDDFASYKVEAVEKGQKKMNLLSGTFKYQPRRISADEFEQEMNGEYKGCAALKIGEAEKYLEIFNTSKNPGLKMISALIPRAIEEIFRINLDGTVLLYLGQSLNLNNSEDAGELTRSGDEVNFVACLTRAIGNQTKQSAVINIGAYLQNGTPLFYGQTKGIIKKIKKTC